MEAFWASIFGGLWEIAEIQMFGPIFIILIAFAALALIAALLQGGVSGVQRLLAGMK